MDQAAQNLGPSFNKFMPSNFGGFYMPYVAQQNEAQDQYGYDIDIGNKKAHAEEAKFSRKPPVRRSFLTENENVEDEVAVPLEETKSFSRSPVRNQRSNEKYPNANYAQRSSGTYKRIVDTGSVPAAQLFSNYEGKLSDAKLVSL